MAVHRLSWRVFTSGLWLKGPRENNLDGTLRRARSVHPLRTGSIRSRSGHTQIAAIAPHSLYKAFGVRIAGVGVDIRKETVPGTFANIATDGFVGARSGGDLTFAAGAPTIGKDDHIFVAGGANGVAQQLAKINPALTLISQWGIDPPDTTTPPDAALGTRLSKTIHNFESTAGWTATVIDEEDNDDTAQFPPNLVAVTGRHVQGTSSLRFRAARNRTTRLDTVLDDGGGGPMQLDRFVMAGDSADEDYIELFVAILRPKRLKSMEISFLVGDNAGGFPATTADFDDWNDIYHREVTFRTVRKNRRKVLLGTGDFIKQKDVEQAIIDGRINKIDFSIAEFIGESEINVARRVWARITIAKSSFSPTGEAETHGWGNVRGLRLSFECQATGHTRVWLDGMRLIGGTGMQGDYNYMFTFFNSATGTRSNPSPKKTDTNGDIIYDPVVIRNVERQPVVLGAVNPLPAPLDPQVTHIEFWRTVGNGVAFFLADRQASTSAAPLASYTDRVADYPGMFTGGAGILFLQPEELPDDNDRPDDTLRDVVGPFLGRMWMTRGANSDRVWYSPIGRLEAAQNFLPVGAAEVTQKLVIWNGELFCFTERSIFRLIGTDEPFAFIEVYGARGTTVPRTVVSTPWGVVYQASDGVRVTDGLQSLLVGDDALAPVFRGGGSDGLAAFIGDVATYGRNEYFISDGLVTLSFSPDGGWRVSGTPVLALFYETDTGIVLATLDRPGAGATTLVSFEGSATGETDNPVGTATADIGGPIESTFEVETGRPSGFDAFKGGGLWGIVQRIYVEGQTNGQSLSVDLVLDNAVISVGTISTASGVKQVMELGVQRAGYITGVRITATGLTTRIEISAIEVDLYAP